jgi:hypothetical protein
MFQNPTIPHIKDQKFPIPSFREDLITGTYKHSYGQEAYKKFNPTRYNIESYDIKKRVRVPEIKAFKREEIVITNKYKPKIKETVQADNTFEENVVLGIPDYEIKEGKSTAKMELGMGKIKDSSDFLQANMMVEENGYSDDDFSKNYKAFLDDAKTLINNTSTTSPTPPSTPPSSPTPPTQTHLKNIVSKVTDDEDEGKDEGKDEDIYISDDVKYYSINHISKKIPQLNDDENLKKYINKAYEKNDSNLKTGLDKVTIPELIKVGKGLGIGDFKDEAGKTKRKDIIILEIMSHLEKTKNSKDV